MPKLTHSRISKVARLVPIGSHTAVKVLTIDYILRVLVARVIVRRTIVCTNFGRFRIVVRVLSLIRKEYRCCCIMLLIVL